MAGTLYVKLDASYDDDEKIILAGEKAELLYVRGLCLAKRILSDGFISDAHLPKFGLSGVAARAMRLCEVGLWERDDDARGYWIVSWLKHNRSAEQVQEVKEKRRAAGHEGGKQSAKQRAKQSGNQSAEASGNQTLNPEEVGVETEEKGESARKRAHQLPDDWKPNDAHRAKALELGVDADGEAEAFRDHHLSHGKTLKDWDRGFHTWLRNTQKFGANAPLRGNVTQLRPDGTFAGTW